MTLNEHLKTILSKKEEIYTEIRESKVLDISRARVLKSELEEVNEAINLLLR